MAFPTSTDVLTMDYSQNGMPFVDVPTNSTVNTFTMDYSQNGMPFVTNPSVSGPANIKNVFGVGGGNIGKLDGVLYANIESVMGVS